MPIFILFAQDDSASTIELLTSPSVALDRLTKSIVDLGGEVRALLTTAGRYPLVGIVDLPSHAAATGLSLVSRAIGRKLELVPAVDVHQFGDVLAEATRITAVSPLSGDGDGDSR